MNITRMSDYHQNVKRMSHHKDEEREGGVREGGGGI